MNSMTPPVAWLRITDYMHGWLQNELGGSARIGDMRVVCVQHLPGAKEALRMEASEDITLEGGGKTTSGALSATRHNCIAAGLELDAGGTERLYGIGRSELAMYAPIECPKLCMTRYGVLRPWTNDVSFGRKQATALLKVLREAFWRGVAEFDREYARRQEGNDYPAIDMIEAFCLDNGASDLYADAMRREWMRQRKKMLLP